MSAAPTVPDQGPPDQSARPAAGPPDQSARPAARPPDPVAFKFSQSDSFAPLLKRLGVSLLVTTYQANKLLVLREQRGGLSILVRTFERPMGVAADPRRIALGTRDQVWQLRNAPAEELWLVSTRPASTCTSNSPRALAALDG